MALKISDSYTQQVLATESPIQDDEPSTATEVVQTEPVIQPVVETAPVPAPNDPPPPAPVETIVEPVSPEPQAAPVIEPAAQPTFEQMLDERSGGRFKSYDELTAWEQSLQQPQSQQPSDDVFADETIRLVNGFVKLGKGDFATGVDLITKDYAQMDGLDVLREYSKLKEPFLTPEQREFAIQEISDKLDPELNDAKAVQSASIALQREVNQKRQELVTEQTNTINGLRTEIGTIQPAQVPQQDLQAAQQVWNKKVDADLGAVSELTFTAPDGAVLKFGVDDNVRGAAKNDLYNIDNFSERYLNPDKKSYDYARLNKDMVWLNNKDAIIAEVYKQAKSGGVLATIGEVVNAPVPIPAAAPASAAVPENDPIAQARKVMLGRR